MQREREQNGGVYLTKRNIGLGAMGGWERKIKKVSNLKKLKEGKGKRSVSYLTL